MKKLLLVSALLCVSGIAAAQMNYDDAVAENDSFYGSAVDLPPNEKGLGSHEEQEKTDTNELVIDTLYLKPAGVETGGFFGLGIPIPLTKDIVDYKALRLTYRLQQEGIGTHTRTITISTALWYTDSSHSKADALYRYSESAGADKNRWSFINFWRTGTKQLWAQKGCDHYCDVKMIAVEGIK
ncbi:hypothetical protein ACP6H1_27310 [Vibrio harveyi]|uniref:hypothetical protein n=1 Tax=Vibrio harveyi TaxID=669 RepID=UPI003CF95972